MIKDLTPGDNCPRCHAELGPDDLRWTQANGGRCAHCSNIIPNYKSKAMMDDDETGPTGLKAIKSWIAKIEEDMAEMHKAEQGAVMEVGTKAIKLLKSCMAKAYGDDGAVEEEEEVIAAKDGDELETEEQVVAGKRLKVFKSLSKTQRFTIKDATEFLDDASQAADTPKRLKSGMAHHAMQLKELVEERKQEQLVSEEEEMSKDGAADVPLDEEGQGKLEELAKTLQAGVERIESIDRKMFQVAGRQYRNGNGSN